MSDIVRTGGNMMTAQEMNSLEIAEVAGMVDRHDNVKRTIETLAESGKIAWPQIEDVQQKGGNNRNYTTSVYVFTGERGKRDSIVVVSRLSPEHTAALVDRWLFLEEKAAAGVVPLAGEGPALPTDMIAPTIARPRSSLELTRANTAMLLEVADEVLATRAEQARQAEQIANMSGRVESIEATIETRIAQGVAQAPHDAKPQNAEAISYWADYWNIRQGIPPDISRDVLTQSPARIAHAGSVRNKKHEDEGAREFRVYQQSVVNGAMEAFLAKCVPHATHEGKVTHLYFGDRKFSLHAVRLSHEETHEKLKALRAERKKKRDGGRDTGDGDDMREAAQRRDDLR